MTKRELKEKLAAIEHERWADWQRYVHDKIELPVEPIRDTELVGFPYSLFRRWERQIATPYDELSEQEKQSDREQVDRYWDLIEQYIKEVNAPRTHPH